MSLTTSTFGQAVALVKDGTDARRVAQTLLNELNEDEKMGLLQGEMSFWKGMVSLLTGYFRDKPQDFGPIPRLEYPGVCFSDGPRGCNLGNGTTFPVAMARGATWDTTLEQKVGHVMGLEARAMGANLLGSVCINLPRHPAWGRVQESYSEDPFILGELAAAHIAGAQKNVMACVKHYALNSMEIARFQVDVTISDAALHEVYLPHFRRAVEAGALSFMSSYNSVNGQWAGQSKELLTNILREQWGFEGFVITDWVFGVRDAVLGVKNGLDIEAPFKNDLARHLGAALRNGDISWDDVDRAGSNILTSMLRLYATRDEEHPDRDVLFSKAHRDLAEEVATRSIVLLKNEVIKSQPLLPLDQKVPQIAVIGRLANSKHTGDDGSSLVRSPEVITPYQGIEAAFSQSTVVLDESDNVEAAVQAASQADVAVIVVGYAADDEGEYLIPSFATNPDLLNVFPPPDDSVECRSMMARLTGAGQEKKRTIENRATGGDRDSVRLRARDVEIIKAVAKTNPKTVVSVITAGAVVTEEWRHEVPAILIGWYNGCEGGSALGSVLSGKTNPSGHLPWSMPQQEAHLPCFDKNATSITYDHWHGQRLIDRLGVEAAYPLGFGLSYTSFVLTDIAATALLAGSESFTVSVKATNIGKRDGRCVVQVYGRVEIPGEEFTPRMLIGFLPVDLRAGESNTVTINASTRPLQRWTGSGIALIADKVVIEAGWYSGDASALRTELDLAKGTGSCRAKLS